ncbi:MAG TPA: hypothetical protein PK858_10235, partial [Saprospiraceae bacterium]|nr:hypothetical protein [Saprospiraceae bacterium]
MTIKTLWLFLLLLGLRPASAQSFGRLWLAGYNEFPGVAGYGHMVLRFQGDTLKAEPAALAFNFESTVAVMSDSAG